jgi:cell division protease FtsH
VLGTRKTLLLAGALLIAGLAVWFGRAPAPPEVAFSVFLGKVEQTPSDFKPRHRLQILASGGKLAEFQGRWRDDSPFTTLGYLSPEILDKLNAASVGFEVVPMTAAGAWRQLGLTFLVLGVILTLLLSSTRRSSFGAGMLESFGQSRAKLVSPGQRTVTFADVAGIDEARDEMEEIIAFLREPRKFTKLGARIPKGVLMMGPPGTGKTLLARAIAGEAGVPFFSTSGSDFVEMFVGVGASRVRALFEQGKKSAPCIIFVDELEAVGRQRGTGVGGGHDEREQTLNQLLVEMDGFAANEGVILIGATNRPDVLDPALLRPGRFDRRMVIQPPDLRGRLGILKVHTRKTPLSPGVDLQVIARGTARFVGADLASLVNEAALQAARGDKAQLEMHDFEVARDKVLMGPERRSMVMSESDRQATAYHEAGHAVVGKLMKSSDPIHKVTIIPRGQNLGLTQQLPTGEQLHLSKDAAEDQIALAMGGRAAEELMLGRVTSGAANDIRTATALARRMVCEWGMSDRLGPLSFGHRERVVFLGRDLSEPRRYSEQTAGEIDSETRRIVNENHERARRLVLAHVEQVKLVAEALLELETIGAAELDLLLAGTKVERRPFAAAE